MLYEYAIEPECLNNWDKFASITSGLGVSQGRLVSRFPENWFKKVERACRNFTFRQRKQMGDELARIRKSAHKKSDRQYDSNSKWITNAIAQHEDKPFHAILSENSDSENDCVIKPSEQLLSCHKKWCVEREKAVPRELEEITKAISPLMEISNKIIFVDRNFSPANSRWKESFSKILRVATQNRSPKPTLEYHFVIEAERMRIGGNDFSFGDYCRKKLVSLIPAAVQIRLCRLERREGGEGIHPRYILTNRGGMRIDWGLDSGKPGESTDVGLMDSGLWKQRWNEYLNADQTFELLDEVTLVGT